VRCAFPRGRCHSLSTAATPGNSVTSHLGVFWPLTPLCKPGAECKEAPPPACYLCKGRTTRGVLSQRPHSTPSRFSHRRVGRTGIASRSLHYCKPRNAVTIRTHGTSNNLFSCGTPYAPGSGSAAPPRCHFYPTQLMTAQLNCGELTRIPLHHRCTAGNMPDCLLKMGHVVIFFHSYAVSSPGTYREDFSALGSISAKGAPLSSHEHSNSHHPDSQPVRAQHKHHTSFIALTNTLQQHVDDLWLRYMILLLRMVVTRRTRSTTSSNSAGTIRTCFVLHYVLSVCP